MPTEDRVYRGLVHCHSTHSFDGSCSYAELRALFRDKGLHFACMTEHIEYLDQAKVDAIICDCRLHSDGEFLFVPGIEMDCFTIYFLGVDDVTIDFTDNLSIFRSIHPKAALCVFSHPVKAGFDYPEWLVEICDAVEVLNTKHDGQHYLRPQSESLLGRVRTVRPGAVGLAGMDFHGYSNYSPFHLRLTRPGPLTPSFVLGQLKQGNFSVYKGDLPLASIKPLRRNYLRSRILAMDMAHFVNRKVQGLGFKLPRSIHRLLRKTLEGG